MGRRRARAASSFPCPACGDEVPEGALACRSCGSDDRTGWSGYGPEDPGGYDEDLALPDAALDEEDYQEAVAGLEGARAPSSTPAWARAVALVTLVAILLLVFLQVFF